MSAAVPMDDAARRRALDPRTSFVVQAPAGSGKTELLTRRILTLLATVNEPEQVVALTFTRKAAAEMRQRVVELLRQAQQGQAPADAYHAEGLALAERVLEQDARHDWQLLDDPQRLQLGTIDALATRLAHRLPLVSTLGAPTGIAEDARALHLQAAEMAYATGPCMCHDVLRMPYTAGHVCDAVRRVHAGRVMFHDGDGEVADGVRLHPVCTAAFIDAEVLPAVAKGAARAGRSADDIEICLKPLIGTAPDAERLETVVATVRERVAFYLSTPTYRRAFAVGGWTDVAREASSLAREQRWDDLPSLVDDDMLHTVATIGTYDEIGAKLRQRFSGLVDRIEFSIPVSDDDDRATLRDLIAQFR